MKQRFKNGQSKICGRQPLKHLTPNSLKTVSSTSFTQSILEYIASVVAVDETSLWKRVTMGETKNRILPYEIY